MTSVFRYGVVCLFMVISAEQVGADEDVPLATWQFRSELVDAGRVRATVGDLPATIENAAVVDGSPSFVDLNGETARVTITNDLAAARLPTRALTVEGWVAIEKPREWGGIVGVIQDNGDYERGWLLGYRQSQFCFGLVGAKKRRITYLNANGMFATGDWYYVAATYDGHTMRLFVDGELVAESDEQSGSVEYPETGTLVIGSYQDDNEFYPMEGRIAEVSLHRRALSERDIQQRFDRRKAEFPGVVPTLEPGVGWPTYMRDNSRSGMTTEKMEFPLHVSWCYQATHAPNPAWPEPAKQNFWKEEFHLPARVVYDRAMHVVSDGKNVYFGSSSDDKVYCLDMKSGRERWAFFTEGPVRLAPTIWKESIYVGSDDGSVYCLAAKDGRLKWKFRPALHERRIPGNGRIISTMPIRSGVIIDGDRARFAAGLFPTQGTYQYVLDAQTGSELGKGQLDFSPQGYMQKRGNSLLVARGRAPEVFLAKLQRSGKPISRDAGELARRYPYAFITAGPTHIFGGNGEVAAFAANDARKLWSAPVEGKAYGLAVAAGCLLVSTDSGRVYCFRSDPVSKPLTVPSTRGEADSDDVRNRDSQPHAKEVEEIVRIAGIRRGYCLVLGSRTGWLAREIARQTQMKVIGIENDEAFVNAARQQIDQAGQYGRVCIHQGASGAPAYASSLFNLIVSESMFDSGNPPVSIGEIRRLLRPGGRAVLAIKGLSSAEWKIVERDLDEGAGAWTHMYANPANTACSDERRLNGRLSLQWFGQPGPRDMVDRHHRTVPPLFSAGRLFIPGDNRVIAVDAYNGTVLWNVEIPDSRRVGALRDCGNMVAAKEAFYVVTRNRCLVLDAKDGTLRSTFITPPMKDEQPREWGYVAHVGDQLIGTTTHPGASRTGHSRRMIDETYYDFISMVTSDSIFAVNRYNGKELWHYRARGGAITNPSIAIADGKVFFIESKNPTTLNEKSGRTSLADILSAKGACLVAIDATTGEETWRRDVDLSSIQHQLFVAVADQKIVIVGSRNEPSNNGKEGVWFDILCYDVERGEPLWTASQNQQKASGGSHGEQDQHPVIVNGTIYVEPFAYRLSDGQRRPEWKMIRGGHGCGTVSASASACFFRADNPTMCDLTTGRLTKVTQVSRPGCWINMIPAGGLLLIPEASSGCVCDFPIQSSMAFAPAED